MKRLASMGLFLLNAIAVALSLGAAARAMEYGPQDRESENVEDRRSGPGSLSNQDIARECQKAHIQPSYPGAPAILAESLSRVSDATVYLNHSAEKLRQKGADLSATERALSCFGIALRADFPEELCKACEVPALQAKCGGMRQAADNLRAACGG